MYKLTAPLNNFLKKDVKWDWSDKCQSDQKSLTSDLSLYHFNPKLEIVVAADASESGIGVVILPKYEDGKTKPISRASRSLIAAEKN